MASSDAPKTILLRGSPAGREGVAGSAITPGMFINLASDGELDPAAAGADSKWVARENELIGGSIDDAYVAGEQVPYWACKSGDQVYALLVDEGNVAAGAPLEVSATAGVLGAVSTGVAVARALEAVNNTGGTGPVRIRVEVL